MAEVPGVVAEIPQVGAKFDIVIKGKHYSEQLGLTYGQPVTKGDLLLQLDTRDYEVDLQMAQAKLAKASADLAKLESWERAEEVTRLSALQAEAAARLEQAKRDRDRMQQLLPTHAISQAEFEESELAVATASAAVDSAAALVKRAQAGPTEEEIAVQRALVSQAEAEVEQSKIELSKTTLLAPYDGVITAINVEVGERVAASGDVLVELMDLSYLVAEIGIPESFVGALKVGDQAYVLASGSVEPVTGLVVAINERVDLETRTFRARVAIDNANARFKAGQFARVRIPFRPTTEETLVVPSESIVFIEGQPYVYAVENGRAIAKQIELGLATDTSTQVVAGLAGDEIVITDDPTLVTDQSEVVVETPPTTVAVYKRP